MLFQKTQNNGTLISLLDSFTRFLASTFFMNDLPQASINSCAARRTFCYFELCSICLKKGIGRIKPATNPWNRHKQHVCEDFYYIQALLNCLLWNKMSTTSMRELGYIFLTMSSLHIIASDLVVKDHCHGWYSWMMSNPITHNWDLLLYKK